MCCLKGCVRYIFASLLFESKGMHLWNKKKFFISLQKLFSLSIELNFRILDTQILWCHQMPKYKTRNTFYWMTWEVNIICKFVSLFHIRKEKNIIKKFCKNCDLKTSPRPFCVSRELGITSIRKWYFWSKLFTLDM